MASTGRCLDAESATWLRALSDVGADHDDAVRRLHALLLRAAFEQLAPSLLVARQRGGAEMHGRTHCWSSEPG